MNVFDLVLNLKVTCMEWELEFPVDNGSMTQPPEREVHEQIVSHNTCRYGNQWEPENIIVILSPCNLYIPDITQYGVECFVLVMRLLLLQKRAFLFTNPINKISAAYKVQCGNTSMQTKRALPMIKAAMV